VLPAVESPTPKIAEFRITGAKWYKIKTAVICRNAHSSANAEEESLHINFPQFLWST
jgi:hypothetical protein